MYVIYSPHLNGILPTNNLAPEEIHQASERGALFTQEHTRQTSSVEVQLTGVHAGQAELFASQA